MVNVSKPAKADWNGNPIRVSRATEAVRVSEQLSYISWSSKIEMENDRGEAFDGTWAVASVYRERLRTSI